MLYLCHTPLGANTDLADMPYWRLNDAFAPALADHALTLWFLGYPQQAIETMDQAVRRARGLGRPYVLAMVLATNLTFRHLSEPMVIESGNCR